MVKRGGNVASMGGANLFAARFFSVPKPPEKRRKRLTDLNTGVSNILKIALGFAMSMAAFLYTQDWWVLAWLGTPIWFAITGVRNIVQSVLGGGGLRGSPMLRWKNYVSWERICDSLMYTGISVPLLELVIRKWMLEDVFSLTVTDSAFVVYSIMALANALYICGHNVYRGLPREAIIGNALRSIVAIPLAMFYTEFFGFFLVWGGVVMVDVLLQQTSAIISKMASDTVAAYIEGFADRTNNMRSRRREYQSKIKQLFACHEQLDLLFPEDDSLEILINRQGISKNKVQPSSLTWVGDFSFLPHQPASSPSALTEREEILEQELDDRIRELEIMQIIISLDLMYFWMYQPLARQVLRYLVRKMTDDERAIFFTTQQVLNQEKAISHLFVEGMIGHSFSRPLSFYLERHREYLLGLDKMYDRIKADIRKHHKALRRQSLA
jgi:hypothetical protein